MNKKYYLIFTIFSVLIAGIMYIGSDNIFLGAGVLLLFLVSSIFLFVPKLTKFDKVTSRFHECYHFINNFIISLSIKKALNPAFENTVMSMDNEFKEMLDKLDNMNERDKLNYLNGNYFPFHVYRLFIEIISLYEEEGGDILEMSKYLLQECRLSEEYINETNAYTKKKYFDFILLWGISLAILVLLRFTLSQFYTYIKNQLFFIISLGVLSLFVAISIFMIINRGTRLNLKGYSENEKIV